MEKQERKKLKEKILTGIKKVLKNNNTELTNKIEKAVSKAVKQSVKGTNKKKTVTAVKNKT